MESAERTRLIARGVIRFCLALGWAPVAEVRLPSGRRLDVLALRSDGTLAAIEVKSGARDFLGDEKWGEYRDWCDALYFAVDADFPQTLLPEDVGLIVSDPGGAAMLREAPAHPLPAARRRVLTQRLARLAATRLALVADPAGASALRSGLSVE
jgi:hypothetical protein